MCGIIATTGTIEKPLLERVTKQLSHRGPDDGGILILPNCALGHRRLSIIDLHAGHQPMQTPDGNYAITYNGELYNYRELKSELAQYYQFRSESDTEVILAAYRHWGGDAVMRFRGMWAFGIWDRKRETLFVSRDPHGIKPLYLTKIATGWAVASEIKPLLEFPGVRARLNPKTLLHSLIFRFPPGTDTAFAGIERLPAGHNATIHKGQLKIKQYASHHTYEEPNAAPEEIERKFQELMHVSVERHLVADVPVGLFLSGGLDSSYLAAVMQALGTRTQTFSIGFDGAALDETANAERVAQALGTAHQQFPFAERLLSDFRTILWHLEEPIADATIYPTFQLAQETRKSVKVALSGDGADEFLGGYAKYRYLRMLETARSFSRVLPQFPMPNEKLRRAQLALRARDHVQAYLEFASVFPPRALHDLVHPDHYENIDQELRKLMEPSFADTHSLARGAMRFDATTWLPNDILLKTDKMAMAHGLEVRVPYLDQDVTSWLSSLPDEALLNRRREKPILRNALRTVFPDYRQSKRKQGFTVPGEIFQKLVQHTLTPERIETQGLFQPKAVEKLRTKSLEDIFARRKLLTILFWTQWADIFLTDHHAR